MKRGIELEGEESKGEFRDSRIPRDALRATIAGRIRFFIVDPRHLAIISTPIRAFKHVWRDISSKAARKAARKSKLGREARKSASRRNAARGKGREGHRDLISSIFAR